MKQHPCKLLSLLMAMSLAMMTWLTATATTAAASEHTTENTATPAPQGSLLIIGGGLRSDNAAIYHSLIDLAGGKDKARIGIFPTASSSNASSQRLAAALVTYGLPREQVYILNLTAQNAATASNDPTLIQRISSSTGLFFVGGDQQRITQAFFHADGTDTPALAAVRELYRNGGVIAGSSAGAAIMSDKMLSANGIPMDTLDFGLSDQPEGRGVYVSHGLGFFTGGIVDQHFNTYNGRPARLARALIEQRVPLGFGVDENTAMLVRGTQSFEVVGTGGVTILDASKATLEDGPLGVNMRGLYLHELESGDAYNLQTGTFTFHPNKSLIKKGAEYAHGNRLITDLSQTNAFTRALTIGLVDNTSDQQQGLLLRYNQNYGYGYQFTFSKTGDTRGYYGNVNGVDSYAVLNARLDIAPVTTNLEPSDNIIPTDIHSIDDFQTQQEVIALVFRGIMLRDSQGRFRPHDNITRAELANIIVHADGLELDQERPQPAQDVSADNPYASDINIAVSHGILTLADGNFRPNQTVSLHDLGVVLKRLSGTFPSEWIDARSERADRETVARAFYKHLGFKF